MFLDGRGIWHRDAFGREVTDDSFYVVFNAHHGPVDCTIPAALAAGPWRLAIDTAGAGAVRRPDDEGPPLEPGAVVTLVERSVQVDRRPLDPG